MNWSDLVERSALLGAMALLLVLPSCAAQRKELQAEQDHLLAEAREEEEALAALSSEAALARIRSLQDARRDPHLLSPLVHHADPRVRAEGLRAMGLIGKPESLGALSAGLEDGDEGVRIAAAFSLSLIASWEVTSLERVTLSGTAEDALLDALDRAGPSVADEQLAAYRPGAGRRGPRASIVRALGEIGAEAGWERLWATLEAGVPSPGLRVELLLALALQAKRGAGVELGEAQVTILSPLLLDPAQPAQWAAAYLLARAVVAEGAAAAAQKILALALNSATEPDARAWILRAIGTLGAPGAVESIASRQGPESPPRERLNAVRAAGSMAEAGVPLLISALADEDPQVRSEAAAALGRQPTDASWSALLAWEPEGGLVAERIRALGGFAGTAEQPNPHAAALLPLVIEALAAGDPMSRVAGYSALAALQDPAALSALLAAASGEDDTRAKLALGLALSLRPEPGVEGPLSRWLLGEDPVLAAVSAEGLAKHEGDQITALLVEAAEGFPGDAEAERRAAVAEALIGRGDSPKAPIVALLMDPNAEVRGRAYAAMKEREGWATSNNRPRDRPLVELDDPWFGVRDVRGATLRTSRGEIPLVLFPERAPGTVANWVKLAERGYFDGLLFHRVVADFVVQAGDPRGDGWGGPGYAIRCEYNDEPYRRGTLGMALSGKDTGGSQWFITLSPQPHLDGHYTVFGRMSAGWDVLDAIRRGDRIEGITVLRGTAGGASP